MQLITTLYCVNFNNRIRISSFDGVLCQSRDHKSWHGCRSTLSVTRGQYYYKVEVTDEGLCGVGWATSAATLELGQLSGNGH